MGLIASHDKYLTLGQDQEIFQLVKFTY